MPKIKPFVWKHSSDLYSARTEFGYYYIEVLGNYKFKMSFILTSEGTFNSLELAKRAAFDDFKRRLEETLGESVGYDLEIDENC